jgi:guanosine-3',5'-bis(diphosphate) 3'-pyrophosphohydrolase
MATTVPLWHRAADFAARAHRHQVRKDGLTPYVAHPARVAIIVAAVFGERDETAIASAWLHDVIEDCDADYDDVEAVAGRAVAEVVAALTKDMRLPEPEREPAYDAQLAAAPWQARLVKLADVYDNVCDADTPGRRSRAIEKAERAIALAGTDRRLERAAAAVRELVRSVRSDLDGPPPGGAEGSIARPCPRDEVRR